MTDTTPPPIGSMYLWDAIEPPLPAGSYRLSISAEARFETGNPERLDNEKFFDVDAPRFNLPPAEVAEMVPPRNAHGDFHLSLPHVVLGRRTLPWERTLDQSQPGTPWLALLLFDADECRILDQQPLEEVVPPGVFARLGRPSGVLCDAVEVDHRLLADIMPSVAEVSLLTHVRQVNVDDRELAAEDSDGWFAIVIANRLPTPGMSHVACLVSIEERTDLVPAQPPAVDLGRPVVGGVMGVGAIRSDTREHEREHDGRRFATELDVLAAFGGEAADEASSSSSIVLDPNIAIAGHLDVRDIGPVRTRDRLVLLHRWKFDDDGSGTFRELMQALDVGMFGKVVTDGQPVVTDTGHIPMTLHDRDGVDETVWYRGPLVPDQLSRDELGPYHSADQARRVSPETGAEDISYAAAFEVGRLLAAADQRLAVELMRWRRGAYSAAAQDDVVGLVRSRLPHVLTNDLLEALPRAVVPVLSAGVLGELASDFGPIADPYRSAVIAGAPGLDPQLVREAWRLESLADAEAMLTATPLTAVVAPVDHAPLLGTFEAAVGDAAGIDRLDRSRTDGLDGGGG
jgi:hypothetical protein